MPEDFVHRYFDVQAEVGAIPVGKYRSTATVQSNLVALGHVPLAVQKELSDIAAKMSCADLDGEYGTLRQSVFRLHGASREECPDSCHYLQNGINCILYLIMINQKNSRLIDADLAARVVLS